MKKCATLLFVAFLSLNSLQAQFNYCSVPITGVSNNSGLSVFNNEFYVTAYPNNTHDFRILTDGNCNQKTQGYFPEINLHAVVVVNNTHYLIGSSSIDSVPMVIELNNNFEVVNSHRLTLGQGATKGIVINLKELNDTSFKTIVWDLDSLKHTKYSLNSNFGFENFLVEPGYNYKKGQEHYFTYNNDSVWAIDIDNNLVWSKTVPPDQNGNMNTPSIAYGGYFGMEFINNCVYVALECIKAQYDASLGKMVIRSGIEIHKYSQADGKLIKKQVEYTKENDRLADLIMKTANNSLYIVAHAEITEQSEKKYSLMLTILDSNLVPTYYEESLESSIYHTYVNGLEISSNNNIGVLYQKYLNGTPASYLLEIENPVGINSKEYSVSSTFIAPNPFSREIRILEKNIQNYSYKFINSLGQIILQGNTSNNIIPSDNLPAGIYVLSLENSLTRSLQQVIKVD